MKYIPLIAVLILTACADYRTPSISGDPVRMSSDTLCFRYANSKDPALEAEIARRDLDCAALLREDPLFNRGADFDSAYRIGR